MNPLPPSPEKRRRFPWMILRRIVITVAWTASLIALAYSVENWRCRRAWEQYRSAAEARGEHLDLAWFIPKPVPDDQNFFMSGSLPRTLFYFPRNERWFSWNDPFAKLSTGSISYKLVTGGVFHLTDLATWQKAFAAISGTGAIPAFVLNPDPDPAARVAAAPAVLRGLEPSAPALDLLRAASSRPYARFPLDYDAENPAMIALPQYSVLQNAVQRLALRASAELAIGRNDGAMADLRLMFYLADTIKNEPMLITGLVRIGILRVEARIIWEGLVQRRWSDAQLQEIQRYMLSLNYFSEFDREIACQRASGVVMLQYYGTKRNFNGMRGDFQWFYGQRHEHGWSLKRFLIWIMPRGWYHLEQISFCEGLDTRFQSVFDPATKRIFPPQLGANALAAPLPTNGDLHTLLQHRYLISKWLAPKSGVIGGDGMVRRYAAAQCIAGQAVIACGLERCRMATGNYPAEIHDLAPRFTPSLPSDPLTGNLFRYRRKNPGSFTLYSVGWNLKDDGGRTEKTFPGAKGDWLWQ